MQENESWCFFVNTVYIQQEKEKDRQITMQLTYTWLWIFYPLVFVRRRLDDFQCRNLPETCCMYNGSNIGKSNLI